MVIDKINTWPTDLINFFDKNYKKFIGWECKGEYCLSPMKYDLLVHDLINILKKYCLTGYHCTKLLQQEIDNIYKKGLTLQCRSSMQKRIDLIEIDPSKLSILERLKLENQCDEINRKGMIWFCFFYPKMADDHGIMRFFRSWGGEALYNSHERDKETGQFLREIGIPCIIEANVPMKIIPDIRLPYGQVTRVYLEYKGYELENLYEYEGYIIHNLPSKNIIDIHNYPSKRFIELTGCMDWDYRFEKIK
ncbi:hypothetical protein EXM22_01905 [Oceanispirochaeta crateris]|uniref:Uncharacterized protein n=1 Tax=Oceanispirochaeta crateris TaxID=2518645 RepID=A0A5C1QJN2_9SPIO|nr:hypothetical protein [Oceanispirochaeta crateris]QEN06804.1 hypothetical protein EXM22_01905 [Oceanispirochaeta crateris]